MTPTRQASFRIFRLWDIDVHLHWSWFIVAVYSISTRIPKYESPVWGLLEYLTLFLIVLMHEFGHALACRQVGGVANQIVLWPLGGVAYVAPPPRPGATLWSIAAGPLVNVALMPLFVGLVFLDRHSGWRVTLPDVHAFIVAVTVINAGLLVFNLLPVFPLDGGQILRSLLWYPLGQARSLMAATVVGFIGGAGLVGLAIWEESIWMGVIAFFLLSYCWQSFKQAKALRHRELVPRRHAFACPICDASPPLASIWACRQCRRPFDIFASAGTCPHCGASHEVIPCPECGNANPLALWKKDDGVVIDA
jgi:Zn-dependent protease